MILTFYFEFISNEYFYIVSVGWIMTALSCILSFFIHESPIWLLKSGKEKIPRAILILKNITRIN